MMKKILMSVYAACALLVIIGSLLWFVFTLNSDSAAGKTEALKRFKVFAQHTGEILSESAQENDYTRLQIRLEQLCRNYSKYVQSVVMRDSAGIVFIWPQNTDFFSYNEQYVVEVKNLPLFFTAADFFAVFFSDVFFKAVFACAFAVLFAARFTVFAAVAFFIPAFADFFTAFIVAISTLQNAPQLCRCGRVNKN